MNVMMELRKCCNHPYLLNGVEEEELVGSQEVEVNKLVQSSGKLVLIDKLLPKLKEGGHKILIFSQMIRVLNILEDFLELKNYKYERIDGNIRGNDRQKAIDRFTADPSIFVFLLCTRAGGLGINLTAADIVIIFDSDWNPQNDLQAQARCHRIGQEKLVLVYRLITRNTYEQKMFDIASKKLGLDQAILSEMVDTNDILTTTTSKHKSKLSEEEVESLLRNGVYEVFNSDNESQQFCEEDISEILARRTTKVVHGKGGSNFSKAAFSSNLTTEVDINDPNFWEKLMPEKKKERKNQITKQKRKRVEIEESNDDEPEIEKAVENEESNDEEDQEDNTEEKSLLINNSWSRVSRNRFQKGLQIFGYGRWQKIKENAGLKQDIDEVLLYGEAYLKLLAKFLNEDMQDTYNNVYINDNIIKPEDLKSIKNEVEISKDSNETLVDNINIGKRYRNKKRN